MSRNKYIKDYSLTNTVDESGRIRTGAHYIGDYYVFASPAEKVAVRSRVLAAFCAAGWLFWLLALLPSTAVMHLPYFSVPYALCAVPLWLVSDIAVRALRARPPYDHKAADKLSSGLRFRSVVASVVPAAAVIGYAVAAFLQGSGFGIADYFALVSACAVYACGICSLVLRGSFGSVRLEKQPPEAL